MMKKLKHTITLIFIGLISIWLANYSIAEAATIYYCQGRVVTISGTGTIYGTENADVILDLGRESTIYGYGGEDWICAGQNDDPINGSKDIVKGGAGDDHIFGGSGKDELYGEAGNDEIVGGADSDRIFGGGGNDKISAGTGPYSDYVEGGEGDDYIYGYDLALVNSTGYDANDGGDELYGNGGKDYIYGDCSDLRCAGNTDNIYGGKGNDTLYGGPGNDKIIGGVDTDKVFAGRGNDTCDIPASTEAYKECEIYSN
jgi:Ca2+-binding RTX toxin-like protein